MPNEHLCKVCVTLAHCRRFNILARIATPLRWVCFHQRYSRHSMRAPVTNDSHVRYEETLLRTISVHTFHL